MKQQCETCLFWEAQQDRYVGVCRRYPPIKKHSETCDEPDPNDWDFPVTVSLEWCGEFKAVNAPPPEPRVQGEDE